jgi:hypothetical protein
MMPPSELDPFLPLNYRWEWASWLVQQAQPLDVDRDDQWIQQAFEYLCMRANCKGPADFEQLAKNKPSIHQAYGLSRLHPPHLRLAVEARILAGEPFDVIGRKWALTTEAVSIFERLFFGVAEKLQAPTWIATRAIGVEIHVVTEHDLGTLWRHAGYFHGPLVLDSLIHGTINLVRPESAEQLNQFLAREASDVFTRKKAVAAQILPVTRENAHKIVRLAGELKRMAAAPADAGPALPTSLAVETPDSLVELVTQCGVEATGGNASAEDPEDVGPVEPAGLGDLAADEGAEDLETIVGMEREVLTDLVDILPFWPDRAAV